MLFFVFLNLNNLDIITLFSLAARVRLIEQEPFVVVQLTFLLNKIIIVNYKYIKIEF